MNCDSERKDLIMAVLKNTIEKEKEFMTEIFIDGEDDAAVVTFANREIDAVDEAMIEFEKLGMDASWISRIETVQVPQHYTADELA
tara:strand:+ start:182 stop:439 length:258 start_codon:yes stop_codon:yes gene_type:complete